MIWFELNRKEGVLDDIEVLTTFEVTRSTSLFSIPLLLKPFPHTFDDVAYSQPSNTKLFMRFDTFSEPKVIACSSLNYNQYQVG